MNRKTRIAVRWGTTPALVGYADTPEQRERAEAAHNAKAPDFVGTARQCLEYRARIKGQLGGTFSRWDFALVKTGEAVALHDLQAVVEGV